MDLNASFPREISLNGIWDFFYSPQKFDPDAKMPAAAEYTGTSPDQRVKVVFSGDFRAKRVEIDPAAELTRETLEPQVLAALENGMEQVRLAAKAKLKEVAGGMDIPGL